MSKQALVVEWEIAKNDADWEHLCPPLLADLNPVANGRLHRQCYFWSVAALLLLLASAGDWWWHISEAALPQPTAEVTAPAQPALGAAAPDSDALVASVLGDQTATDWWRQGGQAASSVHAVVQANAPAAPVDIAVRTVEVWGERAVVNIVTRSESSAPAYRQTRFYQRTATAWLRTEPDAVLWGPARSLETSYFIFHFRQHDAPAVIAVALRVDALYLAMQRNFGLTLAPEAEKLVIEVDVTDPPGHAPPWLVVADPIHVPSPAVYLVPVELTDEDLLAQSIALPLLAHVLAQARDRNQIELAWQPLLGALSLWQVWDLDLPLARGHEEVVRWIYLDLPATPPGQAVMLPDRYTEFCAMHSLWVPSPAQLGIPFGCTELEGKVWFFSKSRAPRDPLTHLGHLAVPVQPDEQVESSSQHEFHHAGQTVALATLIEYAVATYGRERLPALVAGLGQYDRWETLIPAVFGVSPAAFETGWQAYLAAHYGSEGLAGSPGRRRVPQASE